MSYQNFRDPEKGRWDVWLVLPAAAERRKEERRAASAASAAAYTGIERRMTPSRRRISFPLGFAVQRGYENGWLCFESEQGEKRRLVPIPDSWERASSEQLWRWCMLAIRVVKCGP